MPSTRHIPLSPFAEHRMAALHPGRVPGGRARECETLDRLLDGVRAHRSPVLVLCGEAGIAKTTLLDYVEAHASGCHISRATGIESEMELSFAGLHQLCAPMLDRLDHLPGPQHEALGRQSSAARPNDGRSCQLSHHSSKRQRFT